MATNDANFLLKYNLYKRQQQRDDASKTLTTTSVGSNIHYCIVGLILLVRPIQLAAGSKR